MYRSTGLVVDFTVITSPSPTVFLVVSGYADRWIGVVTVKDHHAPRTGRHMVTRSDRIHSDQSIGLRCFTFNG